MYKSRYLEKIRAKPSVFDRPITYKTDVAVPNSDHTALYATPVSQYQHMVNMQRDAHEQERMRLQRNERRIGQASGLLGSLVGASFIRTR